MELPAFLYKFLVRPSFLKRFSDSFYRRILSPFALSNARVLDFGCGTGDLCRLFGKERYIGVDILPDRIALARRLHPGYKFAVARDGGLPIADRSLDAMLVASTLHHMSDDECGTCCEEFSRALQPSGTLLCVEPCFRSDAPWTNQLMRLLDRGRHIRYAQEYVACLSERFDVSVHGMVRKFLYNEVILRATPRARVQ